MNILNKVCKTSIAFILGVSLIGCAPKKESATTHTVNDGNYTGIGTGYNGYVTVSASFRNGVLTNVIITDQQETKAVSDAALTKIPEYVISEQSLNVDVSTGATQTSKAVIEAIGNAITAANGNVDEWQKDCTGKNKEKMIQEDTDVTVVGGGAAGIATVLRLQEMGYKTSLIEKDSEIGGSLRYYANSGQIVAGSTKLNLFDIDPSEPLAEDIAAYSNQTNNAALTQILEDNIGETVDWQSKILGITFDKKTGYIPTDGLALNSVMLYDESSGEIDELLQKEVKVSGASVHTNAGIIGLRYDEEGKVIGVRAKKSNGDIIETTSKYVVLATGTAAGNLNMIPDRDHNSNYLGLTTNTGDALALAKDTEHPYQIEDGSVIYNYLGYSVRDITLDTYLATKSILSKGVALVNNTGDRFIDETEPYNQISDAIHNQNNATSYLVMNEEVYQEWKKKLLSTATITKSEEKYLESMYGIVPFSGETLSEAAVSADLDAQKLLETISFHNLEIDASSTNIMGKIDPEKPTCIIPLNKYRFETTGGLKVDTHLNLLDGNGLAQPNVFAVGSVAGNVFGEKMPGGAGLAWAFVSGKYVADEIVNALQE
ncbi:FAD-dependent oxidoreductase [uncultured Solobacterium sp.]|uniref:FAD-dependent oxidoreductase n=1 Tax=uncultured Solobacterium sp. TaxID=747375 RepID=UPI0025CFC7B7|nr:FAD-dependent oxidoreductase [uncultured Solobacterium sp.]